MRRMTLRALPLVAAAVMLTACYESVDVTRHDPGVYKGQQDPLVQKLESDGDLREQLNQRLNGQRDR